MSGGAYVRSPICSPIYYSCFMHLPGSSKVQIKGSLYHLHLVNLKEFNWPMNLLKVFLTIFNYIMKYHKDGTWQYIF